MEKKRSIGVTVFGIIMLIGGIFTLLGSLAPVLPFFLKCFYFPLFFFFGRFLLGRLAFFSGLFYLIIGIDTLRLKNWARVSAVYLSCLMGFISIIILIKLIYEKMFIDKYNPYFGAMITGTLLLLFLYINFIIFFTRPKLKEQFRVKVDVKFKEPDKVDVKFKEPNKVEKIQKIIVREGFIILGIFLTILLLMFLPVRLTEKINFSMIILTYPLYLLIRFTIWANRKLKE